MSMMLPPLQRDKMFKGVLSEWIDKGHEVMPRVPRFPSLPAESGKSHLSTVCGSGSLNTGIVSGWPSKRVTLPPDGRDRGDHPYLVATMKSRLKLSKRNPCVKGGTEAVLLVYNFVSS